MEYFPKMLIYRASLLGYESENIEDVIKWFHNRLKKGFADGAHIFCAGDSLDDNCLYEYCCNEHLRRVGDWIMKTIVLTNPMKFKTLTTRMRIGSGLLEQVEMKTGGKDLKLILFNNFVNNVWSLYRQKMVYDLPFYQGQGERDLPYSTIWSISVSLNLRLRP